jgi:phosphoglycerate dehydrogenase-like enzyme
MIISSIIVAKVALISSLATLQNFIRNGLIDCKVENRLLLIIGVGKIGCQIVIVGRGLRMKVIGVDIK